MAVLRGKSALSRTGLSTQEADCNAFTAAMWTIVVAALANHRLQASLARSCATMTGFNTGLMIHFLRCSTELLNKLVSADLTLLCCLTTVLIPREFTAGTNKRRGLGETLKMAMFLRENRTMLRRVTTAHSSLLQRVARHQ